jgi:hypothetical protein
MINKSNKSVLLPRTGFRNCSEPRLRYQNSDAVPEYQFSGFSTKLTMFKEESNAKAIQNVHNKDNRSGDQKISIHSFFFHLILGPFKSELKKTCTVNLHVHRLYA